ncbi:MAG: prepilin peptidase [Candidatus Dojkabacteria bacterium]
MFLDLYIISVACSIGVVLGSFLNVLILRIHDDEPWFSGRSRCPHCDHQLGWKELIPVISYLHLRGKCRHCGSRISLQYPLVELLSGLIVAGVVAWFGVSFEGVVIALLGILLPGIFVSDIRFLEIPNFFSFLAIILACIYQVVWGADSFVALITASVLGTFFFLAQFIVTRGKGIGFGDVYLGLLMGLMLGWPSLLYAILIAYVGGSTIALSLVALRVISRKSPVPLGVFLVPALVITFIWEKDIVEFFNSFLGLGFFYA